MRPVLCLLLIFCLAACEDDQVDLVNEEIRDINEIVEDQLWTITYFFDTDREETSNFAGYSFTFQTGGTLQSSNGSDIHTGTWSVHDSNPDDGSADHDDISFILNFDSPEDFEELSDSWQIITLTNVKIELKHVSGGNGGTDLLTFERFE